MSKELDDFLFSGGNTVAPVQQDIPPVQAAPSAQVPGKPASNQAAIAPPASKASFNAAAVPMPQAADVVPQVAAAASAAKAGTPAIEVKSPVKSLSDEIFDNWKTFAIGAGGVLGAQVAGSLLKRKLSTPPAGGTGTPANTAPAERTEPVFATPEETKAHEEIQYNRMQEAERRKADFERMWSQRPGATPTVTPDVSVAPVSAVSETPAQVLQRLDEKYGAVAAPTTAEAAAAIPPAAPATTPAEAIAANPSATNAEATNAAVREQLAEPRPTETEAITAEPKAGKTKGRPTKAAKEALAAAAPPGFHPQYKKPAGGMGPGAFNHLANNLGLEEATRVWQDVYGQTNVPYEQYIKDYSAAHGKQMMGPVQPLPEGVKPGGSFGTPKYVPEYIKGRASMGGMAGLAAMAAALGLASTEKGKAAMEKAAGAIRDLGISPDIFQGKGEEYGRLGTAYVTAGNPAYLRELTQQLKTEADPQRRAVLMQEIQKITPVAPR